MMIMIEVRYGYVPHCPKTTWNEGKQKSHAAGRDEGQDRLREE